MIMSSIVELQEIEAQSNSATLSQGHRATKWGSRDSNPGSLAPEPSPKSLALPPLGIPGMADTTQ